MRLLVNGESTDLATGVTVEELLDALEIKDVRGVAVAVNGNVIPRSLWSATRLLQDHNVEVLRAVQGG